MKKFYLFAIAVLCSAISLNVYADIYIDIYIDNGSEQYQLNCDTDYEDVLQDGGSVRYVASEHALYLNNASIQGQIHCETESELNIYLKGTNLIDGTNNPYRAFRFDNVPQVVFAQDPTATAIPILNIKQVVEGIAMYGETNITFNNAGIINFTDLGGYGISGSQFDNTDLVINNTEINISEGTNGFYPSYTYVSAISGINSIKLMDVVVKQSGVVFDSEKKTYVKETDHDDFIKELNIVPKYNIKIGDSEFSLSQLTLNSGNCSDIKNGSAIFNPNEHTLTFDNLETDKVIDLRNSGLKVIVKGVNNIDNYLKINAETSMTGAGTLQVNGQITVYAGNELTIDGMSSLSVKHTSGVALEGTGTFSNVVIKNSTVLLDGSTSAASNLSKLTMEDCFVLSPENAYYDSFKQAFVVGSEKQKVVSIQAGKVYGVTITADGQVTKVHSANAAEIPFKGYDKDKKSSDGYISLSGKTLTLHKISEDYKITITNTSEDGLTIVSDGTSKIQRIVAQINTTIGSGGKLIIEGKDANGLIELNELSPDPDPDKVKGVTLKFNQANVELKYTGSNRAIYAHSTSTESRERNKIDIYDSDIKVTTDPEKPVLEGLYLWSIDRAEITAPSGAKFSKDDQSIIDKDGNKVVKLTITGGEDLDISIGGDPINSRDAEKEGFDERTHTLTLEKAKIKGGSDPAISTGYDDLTILLIGDNVLESKNNNVIEMPAKSTLTIKSGDTKSEDMPTLSLTTGGGKNAKGALWLNGKGSVLIEGVSVEATNDEGAGIASKSSATLTIRNANVTVQGSEGSIVGWGEFVLDGCKIVEPSGLEYKADEGLGMTGEDGKFVLTNEKVVIEASADGLEEVIATTDAAFVARKVLVDGNIYILRDGKVYTIMGERVK